MSLTGKVHVYTEDRPAELQSVFFRIAEWAGSDELIHVGHGRAILEGEPLSGDAALGFSELEIVSDSASPSTFWGFYQEGLVLSGTFWRSPRAAEVADAISRGIDAEIRGKFIPYDMTISIGKRRLINDIENPGEIVGVPFLEVGFFGYGIPEDWASTRAQIRQLPAILKIQQELTQLVGLQMRVTAMWSC